MPHRNRVTPTGEIIATPHRGTLMGNRGVLHDDDGTLKRTHQTRRWIACRLEFKGRRRELLQPRRWTELFFLDEATALAAGHRPCAECRREDYRRWQAAWAAAHPGAPTNADAMDARLHADRRTDHRATAPLDQLPTGTMVVHDGASHLVVEGRLVAWTPAGYTAARRPRATEPLTVITPAATVATIAAGYEPALHPTAVPAVA